MIDRPAVHMRWIDIAEKERWMRSLATLLKVIEDSDALKTDHQREAYNSVRGRLQQEFDSEGLTWSVEE